MYDRTSFWLVHKNRKKYREHKLKELEETKIKNNEELRLKEWESKLNMHYIEDESENQNYRSTKKIYL